MNYQVLTWSAFLRAPTRVDSLLKKGQVVLKRRDGESLVLRKESSGEAEHAALAAAARLLAPILHESSGHLEPLLSKQLPWTRFLPEADRQTFVSEFVSQFEACADLGDFGSLARLLVEWRNTASVYAEGLGDELKAPVHRVEGRVPRPGK